MKTLVMYSIHQYRKQIAQERFKRGDSQGETENKKIIEIDCQELKQKYTQSKVLPTSIKI